MDWRKIDMHHISNVWSFNIIVHISLLKAYIQTQQSAVEEPGKHWSVACFWMFQRNRIECSDNDDYTAEQRPAVQYLYKKSAGVSVCAERF